MIKNTFYFKHDNNARHHPKILQLRAEFGWEGYGIFFALLEILNESNSGKINLKTIKGIALGLNINADFLEQIITLLLDTKLFHKDNDNCIYSLRVMEEKEHRQSLSEAGKKGARKKKKSNKAEATLKPPLSQVKTTLKAGEERRGEERREEDNINSNSISYIPIKYNNNNTIAEKLFFEFKTKTKKTDNSSYEIFKPSKDFILELFTNFDVDEEHLKKEFMKAQKWINKQSINSRKTLAGMESFLTTWISKSINDKNQKGKNYENNSNGTAKYKQDREKLKQKLGIIND